MPMRGVRRHLSLMRHTLSLSLAKNALWSLFIAILAIGSSSCKDEKDEPDNPFEIENNNSQNLSVTINSDGSATGGAVFQRVNETTFYLDYVKYIIYNAHLEIIDIDRVELPAVPKLYAEVTLDGTLYKTRSLSKVYSSGPFQNTKIESISIPNTVQNIGTYIFAGCSSLTSISMPDELTNIGSWTFSDCRSLTSISLPASVTYIGNRCFDGCTSLAKITFNSDIPENTYSWVGLCSIESKPVAYVPKQFLTNYQQSEFAEYFSEIIGY